MGLGFLPRSPTLLELSGGQHPHRHIRAYLLIKGYRRQDMDLRCIPYYKQIP